MAEQQAIPTDEEAERELEEAEKQFEEENKTIVAQQSGETTKEETAKRYQDILIALGFTRYDNKEKGIACKLKAGQLLIGRTFTEKYPIGNIWASCLVDCEYGMKGEFLQRKQCKQIPQVNLFYRIRDGELPIPEPTVVGMVVGKSEKAVQIQFDEFGRGYYEMQWWGFNAIKKNEEGTNYVPASYSKQTENYNAKMQVPRDIILENYETELEKAPLTQTGITKEKEGEEKAEPQPTGKSTMDEVIKLREETIANRMKTYLEKGREMVEQIFPELEQPQLSELSQDIATSMFIEDRKEARKERW